MINWWSVIVLRERRRAGRQAGVWGKLEPLLSPAVVGKKSQANSHFLAVVAGGALHSHPQEGPSNPPCCWKPAWGWGHPLPWNSHGLWVSAWEAEGEREARGMTQECWTFEESTAVVPDCVAGGLLWTALAHAVHSSSSTLEKSCFGTQNKGEKIARNKYLIVALINILSKRSHQSCNCTLERGEILCGTEWHGEVKYFGRQPCGWHSKLAAAFYEAFSRCSVSGQTHCYGSSVCFSSWKKKKKAALLRFVCSSFITNCFVLFLVWLWPAERVYTSVSWVLPL